MSKWRARSTAPIGTPVLVRYRDKWRGDNFTEEFEAEFDGHRFWRQRRAKDKPCYPYVATRDGYFQISVYENSTGNSITGWKGIDHMIPKATAYETNVTELRKRVCFWQTEANYLRESRDELLATLRYIEKHELWINSHAKAVIQATITQFGAGGTAP